MEKIEIPHEVYMGLLRAASDGERVLSEKMRVGVVATRLLQAASGERLMRYTIKRYVCSKGHIRDGQDLVIRSGDPLESTTFCGICWRDALLAAGVGTLTFLDEVERETED